MPLFQNNKKASKRPKEAPEDAFQAIPHHAPQVEERTDGDTGRMYLRYPVKGKGRFEKFLIDKFKMQRHRKFDLDPVGSYFWRLINGQKPLQEIEERMREKFGWDINTCREGVLQYTMTLMEKQLIYLDLSHRAQSAEPQPEEAHE